MSDDTRIATAPIDRILSMGAQLDQPLRQVDETCPRHAFTHSSPGANSCRSG